MNDNKDKFVLLEKSVGETPLNCLESWRSTRPDLAGIPMAYAGRLDPMAEGKLLVLIGEECKQQEKYHGLDKAYRFEILFGVDSDSSDVLGIISEKPTREVIEKDLKKVLKSTVGEISLPYPIFSSRTVQGKPLHTWTLEGRLNEIEIPIKTSPVYQLQLEAFSSLSREEVFNKAVAKINTLPKVTDPRKALGQDFRREAVLASWKVLKNSGFPTDSFSLAAIHCVAGSGTYMRSLAKYVAKELKTEGLAFSINRLEIGRYSLENKEWILKY